MSMTTPIVPLRRATGWLCNCRIQLALASPVRRHASTLRNIVREGEVVLLKQLNDKTAPILSKPLRANDWIKTDRGTIATNDILGKRRGVREIVSSSKGFHYRIYEPTLGEYTDLSPRMVTPIYSQDAALITSLLDLHPSSPGTDSTSGQDRLEIFEAGTGHGALTLHLSRAIHGANPTAPRIPILKEKYDTVEEELKAEETQEAYEKWRGTRRAVVHTLDQSAAYSKHAQMTVKRFRQGMYWGNVDFHVGSIQDFISQRMSPEESKPFLDHAILDLPNTHQYLDIVAQALKTNGLLVTWCPSITQLNKCVLLIKESKLPYWLEKVIEVGPSMNGGKEWDVRFVKPRAWSKDKAKAPESDEDVVPSSLGREEEIMLPESDAEAMQSSTKSKVSDLENAAAQNDGWEMVCRPKVGIRTMGGGFIGLWRKVEM